MIRRTLTVACLLGVLASSAAAQQPQPQPLTFYYDYTVRAGKEADFMDLVKTVGQPVRDRLMAEGVVMGWGIEVPLLRHPESATHTIWFTVEDYSGIEKVQAAMAAQQEKLAAEEAARKAPKGTTTAERSRDVFDGSKTRDWLTRDLVSGMSKTPPPAGALPYTRYNLVKVHQGKGAAYRAAWEKYNKPVYDKLVADGTIWAYGLAVEAIKTSGDFTHFVWVAAKDLASLDRVGAAIGADRARRSQEERTSITDLMTSLTDGDAARSMVTRSIVFRIPGQK